MKCVNDFRLKLGNEEYVPIIIGGMGVEISTSELALIAAELGGIGHISDALVTDIADRKFATTYVSNKRIANKTTIGKTDKSQVQFNLDDLRSASMKHVESTMQKKQGTGLIFINCMEKLTMNNARDTLGVRLNSALDAGIDGITLSAGLHLNSFELIQNNPRFNSVKLGIVVSSIRALRPFLMRCKRTNRKPDYIIIEGPLAGGHLGFAADAWQESDLKTIFTEIYVYLQEQNLNIPLIVAGGIFTGSDAVEFLEAGAAGVQVATRFTIAEECGLPYAVKQEYLNANKEDVIVNTTSPTGYPMRMLKYSKSIGGKMKPNCESLGYLLENGKCAYIDAYEKAKAEGNKKFEVLDKTCLCTHMKLYQCYTCGQYVYRLKDTTNKLSDGSYQIPSARDIFLDYQYSKNHEIKKPIFEEKLIS